MKFFFLLNTYIIYIKNYIYIYNVKVIAMQEHFKEIYPFAKVEAKVALFSKGKLINLLYAYIVNIINVNIL